MNSFFLASLSLAGLIQVTCAGDQVKGSLRDAATRGPLLEDAVVIPDSLHPVRLYLYTNASPTATAVFNSIEIRAWNESLLPNLCSCRLDEPLGKGSTVPGIHNILVGGQGPELGSANGMTLIQRLTGPDWIYVSLDASAAYRSVLKEYKRAILFVEPDLFVVYDHLVLNHPDTLEVTLHPPLGTRVDPLWGDLRLELSTAGLTIQSPGDRMHPRNWRQIKSEVDRLFPELVTMQLSETNRSGSFDGLTVFAVHPAGQRPEFASKMLEGNSAIGARIYRAGLPTLVAFRTKAAREPVSLTGFEFDGPVGVSVFKPKMKSVKTP